MSDPTPTLPPDVARDLEVSGPLTSYWLAVGIGSLAAVVVAVAVWQMAGRSGWRRTVPQVAGVIVATVLLAASVGAASNTYAGYIRNFGDLAGRLGFGPNANQVGTATPRAADPRSTVPGGDQPPAPTPGEPPVTLAGGVVLRKGRSVPVVIPSASGTGQGPATVYVPPGYDDPANAARRYPTVYLLHGDPGGPADWAAGGELAYQLDVLISTGAVPPLIAVTPDSTMGGKANGTCRNMPGGPQAGDYLGVDVPAFVDASFRTVPDVQHRVIGGMSSGGNCSLELLITRRGTFGSLMAFQPAGGPGQGALDQLKNPAVAAALKGRPAMLDVGSKDSIVKQTEDVAHRLKAAGMNVTFRITPGETHGWVQPRVALPYALVDITSKNGWPPDPPRKV